MVRIVAYMGSIAVIFATLLAFSAAAQAAAAGTDEPAYPAPAVITAPVADDGAPALLTGGGLLLGQRDAANAETGALVAGPILTVAAVLFVALSFLFLAARFIIRRRIQRGMADRS